MDDLPPSTQASPAPSHPASSHGHDHHDDHAHDHHELGFIRTYIFSTDHKTIGIQYLCGGLFFLLFGFCLMLLMRWQLAFPGQPLTFANAFNHIMYQVHEVAYHLGLGAMPSTPAVVPADPLHPPLLELI